MESTGPRSMIAASRAPTEAGPPSAGGPGRLRDATVLTARNLERAGFRHGFSLAPLDFGVRRGAEEGARDLEILAAAVGFDPASLRQADQVHGARVVRVDDRAAAYETGARPEADGLAAGAASGPLAVGIRTADCVPILVGDRRLGDVVAIHAGWRGVVRGVVHAALGALGLEGSGDYVAAIGPCIGPCCFEVGAEVAREIVGAVRDPNVVALDVEARGKAMIDLRRAVRLQLEAAGVRDVADVGGCTRCEPAKYHSFRRDAEASGRHLAVIVSRASVSGRSTGRSTGQ